VGNTVWYVKARPARAGDALARYIDPGATLSKYLSLMGSRPAPYGIETVAGRDVVLVAEGEFDALLARQDAGDVVGVLTLGSSSKGLSPCWFPYLLSVRRFLACYDLDVAGAQGAAKLAALSQRVRIIKPPAHDLTDFALTGGDLRAWVSFQVAKVTAGATSSTVPADEAPASVAVARRPSCPLCGSSGERLGSITLEDGRGRYACRSCGVYWAHPLEDVGDVEHMADWWGDYDRPLSDERYQAVVDADLARFGEYNNARHYHSPAESFAAIWQKVERRTIGGTS
jgi:hypothetical protein